MGYKGGYGEKHKKKGSKSNVLRKENVCCVLREAGQPPVRRRNVAKSVFAQCENIPIVASHGGAVNRAGRKLFDQTPTSILSALL